MIEVAMRQCYGLKRYILFPNVADKLRRPFSGIDANGPARRVAHNDARVLLKRRKDKLFYDHSSRSPSSAAEISNCSTRRLQSTDSIARRYVEASGRPLKHGVSCSFKLR